MLKRKMRENVYRKTRHGPCRFRHHCDWRPHRSGRTPSAGRLRDFAGERPALRPRAKFLSIIGSYGWGGKTVETLAGMIPNLKVDVLEPVLCKGVPSKTDFEAIDNLAGAIAEKHREGGFE